MKSGSSMAPLLYLTTTITANDQDEPNSYLTCIACGPPESGICGQTDGVISVAAPVPLNISGTIAEHFEPLIVDSLSTYGPSGRPDQPCEPNIQFTVADPNFSTTQRTNCSVTWSCNDTDASQFKHVPCDDATFWFSITVPDGGSLTEDFVLRVHHVKEESAAALHGNTVNVTYSGQTPAKVPDQMDGECGASGACFWGLKTNETLQLPVDDVALA